MARYTSEQTHKIMSSVHSKNTNIEVKLCKALWHKGYRYRKNVSTLPGKPDIVFQRYKLAVFCDAEFWHGKDWEVLKPKLEKGTHPEFWVSKIERNRSRDNEVNQSLREMDWTVLRFWGKEILSQIDECVRVIEETIFDIQMSQYDFESDEYILRECFENNLNDE